MGDQEEIIELRSSPVVKPRKRHFGTTSETDINKISTETTDSNNFPRSRSSTTILLSNTPNRTNGDRAATSAAAAAAAATATTDRRQFKDVLLRRRRRRLTSGCWELRTLALWQSSLAEFGGTLLFTFVSIAATIATQRAGLSQPRLAVAAAQGAAYAVAVLATAPLSGGHLNPALTLASLFTAHISAARALTYAASQILGAIFGALLVKLAVPAGVAAEFFLGGCIIRQAVVASGGVSVVGPSDGSALAAETFFSLAFIAAAFALFAAAFAPVAGAPPRGCAAAEEAALGWAKLAAGGVLAGVALALLVLVSGQLLAPGYTSAGMNPARCLGSAAAQGGAALLTPQWVFWLGPSMAAILFAIFYNALFHGSVAAAPPASPPPPPPPPPAAPPEKQRRMDVFLHIKATLDNKPAGGGEGMVHRKIEIAPYSPASSCATAMDLEAGAAYVASPPATPAAAPPSSSQVILEHADLSLRNLMDIPSSSSRALLLAADRRKEAAEEEEGHMYHL